MKLYLFGGAEVDLPSRSVLILKNLIKETLLKLQTKSVLHIPFARLQTIPEDKGEWDEGWFKKLMNETEIRILDAKNQSEIDEAIDPVIFINGGSDRKLLIKSIFNNRKLHNLIINSKYIVAESAGSMIMGEYLRTSRTDGEMIKGLGVLKNTVIEPHYTERNYKEFLPDDMEKSRMKYGIGIDSATGIIVNPQEFPSKWEKVGAGNVYVIGI